MRKSSKRLLFFLISLLFVLLCGAIGYTLALQEPRIVEAEPSPDTAEAEANDSRIATGAAITWIYEYDMCRHTDTVTDTADKSLISLSFTQLQQKFPDVRIVSFEPDAVVLEKDFLCYCPLHYILKIKDGSLSVFRTKKGTDESEKLRDFNIAVDDIDKNEQTVLKTGHVFADKSDVERYVYKLMQTR